MFAAFNSHLGKQLKINLIAYTSFLASFNFALFEHYALDLGVQQARVELCSH